MGLDITAYKNVKLIETLRAYEDYESKYDWQDNYDFLSANVLSMWADRSSDLTPGGVYSYEDSMGFRAGSYSWYNYWRNELSKMMLNVEASDVWNNPDRYKEMPFYELINFSDCEGVLGTQVCRDLAEDFETYLSIAVMHTDEWFVDKYNNWLEAFKFAENGYVDFH